MDLFLMILSWGKQQENPKPNHGKNVPCISVPKQSANTTLRLKQVMKTV